MEKYYKILWIKKWASKEEIKKAYRKMSMKYHPDKWWNDYMFTLIKEAYDKLKNNNDYYEDIKGEKNEIIEIKTRIKEKQFWKVLKIKWYKVQLPDLVKKWDIFWVEDNVKIIIVEIIFDKKDEKNSEKENKNDDKKTYSVEKESFLEKVKKIDIKWVNRLTYNLGIILLIFLMVNIKETFFTILGIIWIIYLIILRFRNLWRSGWYILWFFVPLYKIYLFFLLIFVEKSEVKENNGFIKLIIGIFIVTLLAILSTIAFISLQWVKKENIDKTNNLEHIKKNDDLNIKNNIIEKTETEKYEKCLYSSTPSICLKNYNFSENYLWNITEFYNVEKWINHTIYIKWDKKIYFTSENNTWKLNWFTKIDIIFPEKKEIIKEWFFIQPIFFTYYKINYSNKIIIPPSLSYISLIYWWNIVDEIIWSEKWFDKVKFLANEKDKIDPNKCEYKWNYYDKPLNWHCANNWKTAWLCNEWYYEKSDFCYKNIIKEIKVNKLISDEVKLIKDSDWYSYKNNWEVDCWIWWYYNDSFWECFCKTWYWKRWGLKCEKIDCWIWWYYNDSFWECFCKIWYKLQDNWKCEWN